MNVPASVKELRTALGACLELKNGSVAVKDKAALREHGIDELARASAFSGDVATRQEAAWMIRCLAMEAGNGPASINETYLARGRGALRSDFTVPAINIRAFAYTFARAIFRAAKRHEAGAILCELSRSEMGYTNQTPAEYVSSVLAAAIKEGFPWPVFIQGDHFQVNAKNYAKDRSKEIGGLTALTTEAIDAGFYNIDLDTSTLVDLSKGSLSEQQALNCRECADLSKFVRGRQPKGVDISLGGEIGEVGGKNSTVEELDAFMTGYRDLMGTDGTGISKISVQTGTSHGGVVLPDGSIAKVKVDFDALERLSKVGREKFGLGGAVQHGASTLPVDFFDQFPKRGTCEIHLATEFQNILYEHPAFPPELKRAMYAHLDDKCAGERKDGESDAQFYYKTRKKALGPFKRELWDLPDGPRGEIMKTLEEKVDLLLRKLNVVGTGPLIKPFVNLPRNAPARPAAAKAGTAEDFEGDD